MDFLKKDQNKEERKKGKQKKEGKKKKKKKRGTTSPIQVARPLERSILRKGDRSADYNSRTLPMRECVPLYRVQYQIPIGFID